MVIRCKNCYKVLHHQERYCTRCGTESPEVVEVMANGEPDLSEWHKAKVALVICFIIAFMFTGVFSVVMGVLYQRFNPDVIIDDYGLLPLFLSGFSRGYSLFITGIATLLILSIVFFSNWLADFSDYHWKDFLYALLGGVILIGGFIILMQNFNLHIISNYFYEYLSNSVVPYLIILVILFSYAMVEEFVRKLLIEGINEVTIWPNFITVIISGIFSVVFNLLVFFSVENIIVNAIIGLVMGHLYLRKKENLYLNIIIRIIIISIVILI